MPAVDPAVSDEFLQVMLAQSFLNCLMWVPFVNNAINFTASPQGEPSWLHLPLNTSQWAAFVPALAAA
jgi:hypothetical protein